MKKRLFALVLSACALLSACGQAVQQDEDGLTIVTTTYPVYLFTCAVTAGAEGITVERLDTGSTSCLHDYTLSVRDMKKIETADVLVLSGVGLEEFMEDALALSSAAVIDCSEGVALLENESHHHDEEDHAHDGHDHGHFDPHYWMDPKLAKAMAENIAHTLAQLDAPQAQTYLDNGASAAMQLDTLDHDLALMVQGWEIPGLITFHDGFRYFAHAYGLPLLESIEEEAGSEASAREIVEITELVQGHEIPVIFTEVNGSDATAKAVARETGCAVAQLSMLMDGPDGELSRYLNGMIENMSAVINGFAEEGGIVPG